MIYSTQEYFLNPYTDLQGKTHKLDDASERFHKIEIEHFARGKNFRLKMSPVERTELKNAMRRFPNGKGTPVGFNKD